MLKTASLTEWTLVPASSCPPQFPPSLKCFSACLLLPQSAALQACGVRVGVSIPGKSDSFVAVRDAAVVKGPLDLQSPTTVLPATAAAAPKAGGEAQQGAEDGVVKVESEQEGPAAAAGGEGDAGVPEVDGEQQQEEGGQIKPPRPAPPPPEGSMARLLCRVRALGDGKGAAVTAALTTILNIPGLPKLAFPPIVELPEPATEAAELAAREPAAPITAGAAGASGEERAAQQAAETATRGLLPAQPAGAGPGAAAAAGPGPAPDAGFLEKYPRCKSLMEKFPRSRNSPPKTPLQVVHEYATRLSLEVRGGALPALESPTAGALSGFCSLAAAPVRSRAASLPVLQLRCHLWQPVFGGG